MQEPCQVADPYISLANLMPDRYQNDGQNLTGRILSHRFDIDGTALAKRGEAGKGPRI